MKAPRMRFWFPLGLMCWGLLGACASLPNVTALGDKLEPSATPTVKGTHGDLSDARTKALLAKRWSKGSLDLQSQASLEEAATGVPLIAGNKTTLLFDGPQTMTEMLKAINGAQNNINLETYIFDQDELGLKFADALIAKQQAGVTVNILYDSVGTIGVPAEFFKRMRDGGIKLIEFNPVNPAKVSGNDWKLNNRDHRKVLIVDGKAAFTGGINISATYAKSSLFRSASKPTSKSDVGWRDTHIKVEGPAVQAFQWLFVRQWASQDKDDLREADYFPKPVIAGDKVVRVLGSDPGGQFEIYKAYALAFQEAKKSIHITSAYFVPDRQTVDALIAAARRGVDVKIVLPGVSDSGLVFYAGHAFYDDLLAAGVKIYQLKLAVLHAKTAVIDGNWSTVGSTNIDTRSFLHNSELNVIVMGDAFGTEMEKAFQEDMRDSNLITLEAWRHRPWANRMKEWAARFMDYWL
ncbi:cardiolipin synthase [Pseudoduganella sp. FT25W]|uniref:Cardiolipin synthase n=1 Tax=Duganella alba TaxID=2666081 RepID=A0A6L5QGR7_9BURK|nr:cardiolipin synthase [Duganella alba]MRX08957.1 cardiolipin synthase [Duganella alba]MRX18997.1 cardiolipin synthase [Duganella alba]